MAEYKTREARDGIYSTFKATWDDPTLGWQGLQAEHGLTLEPYIRYENLEQEDTREPQPNEPWIWFVVRHNESENATFGNGRPNYEATGTAILQIFTPIGPALTLSDDLVNVAKRAFQGKRGIGDFCGIVFRSVRPNEIGVSERWHQTNVLVAFEYDEAV